MLTCGALGKSVTVKNLNLNSNQGDKIVIDVLKKAGAKISVNGKDITASKGQLKAFDCNLENAPDLAPILATLAVFCKGNSRFYGVERLKIKESDRLLAIIENLKKANIKAEYNGEYLSIIGGTPKACEFNGYNDHRIVMASVIMAGLIDGIATVTDGKAVSKSYPNFYKDFEKIGGKINVQMDR
jgi:3-phosphoshikimate 1-carboxyvinyltransferase